jgi:hypothetical protein
MQLGLPGGIETRKKAYLGVGMDDLLARYNEAERKRDLPEMLALLDIIRAAPKPVEGPKTTVKDDLMAAVQPQQQAMMAPPAAGIEGALTAMENQNAPVLAAEGGAMNFDDSPDTYGFAEGGVARFQFGGAGTVAPFASYAGLSFGDIERMAMMGDPEAQKELSNRMRSGIKPAPTPGPGIGPASPQVTDRFGSPGKIPAGVPGATAVPTPAAAGPTTRPGLTSLASRVAKIPGMGLITRHPYATALTTTAALGAPLVDRLMATDQGTPSAELDAIAAMQGTQGGIDRSVTGDSRFTAPSLRDKGAPTPSPTGVPSAGGPRDAPTAGLPSLPFNLADLKPKSIEDLIAERNMYEAKLDKQGLRSLKDVQSDLEKFRTEGKERAEADRTAAKEAFKEELLLGAALSAPQLLKGRGLSQAVARATETFSPLAMKAAAGKTSAIKEANKAERESADKFKLAQLDLDKAIRAEELGKFDKAASLRADSMKTYTQAMLDKYKADVSYAATMGYVDRVMAKGMVDAAKEQIAGLQLKKEFRDQPIEVQQRIINSILQGAVGQGGQQRPRITDVPGQ